MPDFWDDPMSLTKLAKSAITFFILYIQSWFISFYFMLNMMGFLFFTFEHFETFMAAILIF